MKTVICLMGYAGSGKSTLGRFLAQATGAPFLHLPKVVGHLTPERVRRTASLWGRLFPGAERPFLDYVAAVEDDTVILDGFLRDLRRLRLLGSYARQRGWRVIVIHCAVSPLTALLRQLRRDWRKGLDAVWRIPWKLSRDILRIPAVLAEVRCQGLPFHAVRADRSAQEVEDQVRRCLGLDLQDLPWDRRVLRWLAELAPDAWVTGGGNIYKPFFNGVYGPPSEPWDVDIRVWGAERAAALQADLERRHPQVRWHVKDARTWAKEATGRDIDRVEEACHLMSLVCACAGVRWRDGHVEVYWGHPEAEADLRRGLLRPNLGGQVGFAPDKARKIARYYPGVLATFIGHDRVPVCRSLGEVTRAVRAGERGGRRQWGPCLSPPEQDLARAVLRLRASLETAPQAVPMPEPGPVDPRADPWTASDGVFRNWVANQTRSRRPVGGRDPYLQHALDCQSGIGQKPSHQGWALDLHVIHVLLTLETDALPRYRRALRIAALWHDIGKRENVFTPGAHALRGAKLWKQCQATPLPGLDADEEALISALIVAHDVFGRLERGLWDEAYTGGMDPSAVRAQLGRGPLPLPGMVRLAKELWKADVGAIPVYRWLRHLADPLEQLVLIGGA